MINVTKFAQEITNHITINYKTMDNRRRVLIVEDNFDLAEAARRFLELKRYKVIISDGGNLAEILVTQKPDIIIMDISLGALDGRELCKNVKKDEHTKSIPVIMLSAHERLSKAYGDHCADAYVMKPFALAELLQTIESLLPA